MASFIGGLSASKLSAISRSEVSAIVDLTLPKFSAETRVNLAAVLKAMGMSTAFDPQLADLSGITTEEPLHLSNVIHQANIDVVEEGTTAAAVTVVTGSAGAGPGELEHVQLHVDKPFLYFIRDQGSGAVLFMGRIDDPSAKS
jgi:serpin B